MDTSGMWPQTLPWTNFAHYPSIQSASGSNPAVSSVGSSDSGMTQQSNEVLQQEVVNPVPVQAEQPPVMMNNPMGNDMIRAEDFGEGGEMDVIDRLYMLFRFCLFVGLCFAYSSLDKAIIVFSVAAYVYLYNIYRRYAAANRAVQPPQRPDQQPVNPTDTPDREGTGQDQTSDGPAQASDRNNNPDQELRQRTSSQQEQTQPPGPNAQPQTVPTLSRLTSNLRVVASTSFQFLSGLFTSLIPEQPPPIRLD